MLLLLTQCYKSSAVTLNPFANKLFFTCLLKALCGEEKLLVTSNFSLTHSVFYPFRVPFNQFHQILNCRLQTLLVWESIKFVVWERVIILSTGSNVQRPSRHVLRQRFYRLVSIHSKLHVPLKTSGSHYMIHAYFKRLWKIEILKRQTFSAS